MKKNNIFLISHLLILVILLSLVVSCEGKENPFMLLKNSIVHDTPDKGKSDFTNMINATPLALKDMILKRDEQRDPEGLSIKGNIDLSQTTIEYYSVQQPASGEPAESLPREEEPLKVVDFSPTGELPIEMRKPTIYVMFNHPIVPLAKLGEPIMATPLMTIEPPVKGTYRWYGTRVLSFEPDQDSGRHSAKPSKIQSLYQSRRKQNSRSQVLPGLKNKGFLS